MKNNLLLKTTLFISALFASNITLADITIIISPPYEVVKKHRYHNVYQPKQHSHNYKQYRPHQQYNHSYRDYRPHQQPRYKNSDKHYRAHKKYQRNYRNNYVQKPYVQYRKPKQYHYYGNDDFTYQRHYSTDKLGR